jgi:hypothetical protein
LEISSAILVFPSQVGSLREATRSDWNESARGKSLKETLWRPHESGVWGNHSYSFLYFTQQTYPTFAW